MFLLLFVPASMLKDIIFFWILCSSKIVKKLTSVVFCFIKKNIVKKRIV